MIYLQEILLYIKRVENREMTSKAAARNNRLQADLERNREQGHWKKVIESAEFLKGQNISSQGKEIHFYLKQLNFCLLTLKGNF